MADTNQIVDRITSFFKDALDDRSVTIYDNEAERLLDMIERDLVYFDNVGMAPYLDRIKHDQREKAFHDTWLKWNRAQAGINQGHGVLQDIFIDDDPRSKGLTKIWREVMNTRDRMIVATVIQWLGTNVGMSFLSEAIEAGGQYKLTSVPRKYEEPTTPGQA